MTATTTLTTKDFWVAATERAVKAAAWSLSATLGAGQIGILEADWPQALSVAGMALVLSLLGSITSDVATGGGPSAVSAETLRTTVAAEEVGTGGTVAGPAADGIPEGFPVQVEPDIEAQP